MLQVCSMQCVYIDLRSGRAFNDWDSNTWLVSLFSINWLWQNVEIATLTVRWRSHRSPFQLSFWTTCKPKSDWPARPQIFSRCSRIGLWNHCFFPAGRKSSVKRLMLTPDNQERGWLWLSHINVAPRGESVWAKDTFCCFVLFFFNMHPKLHQTWNKLIYGIILCKISLTGFCKSCMSKVNTTCSLLSDCSEEEIDGCVVNGGGGGGGEKTLSAQTIIKTIP